MRLGGGRGGAVGKGRQLEMREGRKGEKCGNIVRRKLKGIGFETSVFPCTE